MITKTKDQSGLGRQSETRLFKQARGSCQDSLNLLVARHEALVLYAGSLL